MEGFISPNAQRYCVKGCLAFFILPEIFGHAAHAGTWKSAHAHVRQGLKSSGNSGNAVPTRKFDVLVVGTYVPTRRKGLAKFTGALTTNDLSILGLFTKQQTVVSVANSLTFLFEDQTLQFLF